jgi:NADH dehydrogenase
MNTKKIVIVGGGFAGIYAARALARNLAGAAQITLVSKTNYFLFTPMLHEVATGGLGHHQVVEAVRQIVYRKNISFMEAEVTSIDTLARTVTTTRGMLSYDELVLAPGAVTNFFNTPGAAEYSLTLKSLDEAITLRSRIVSLFEEAAQLATKEERAAHLSFVVVGGGPTGVELAAEIAEFTHKTLRRYYESVFSCDEIRITLVQSGSALLPMFDARIRSYAASALGKEGIDVRTNTKVTSVSEKAVTLGDGSTIIAHTVVWTAGVRAQDIPLTGVSLSRDTAGRIVTDAYLRAAGTEHIYVLGDAAHVPQDGDAAYPMLAQVAVAEARLLGKNFARAERGLPLVPFAYHLQGELVSLGQWKAAGTVLGIPVYGAFAWFIWRTVYLFKFISRSKKWKIALDWTINLFFPRDVSKA